MSTINLLDNKILGPAIRQGLEEGRRLGREEGRLEGLRDILRWQIQKRFGHVPSWALEALEAAPQDKLQAWTVDILDAPSLEALLQ